MARTCGLISTYGGGCRCRDCRRAAREHRRKYRSGGSKQYELKSCPFCGDEFYILGGHMDRCMVGL